MFLPAVMFAYNSMPHSTTGVSPYMMLFGRDPVTPMDRMLGSAIPPNLPGDVAGFIQAQRQNLEWAYNEAKERIAASAESNERAYNNRNVIKSFSEGDMVYLHIPAVRKGTTKKLASMWKGPFKIVRKHSDSLYQLDGSRPLVNVQRLRLASAEQAQDPTSDDEVPTVEIPSHDDSDAEGRDDP